MKRSEMINEIYKIMKQFEDCEITRKEARAVLSKVEKLGMLPPLGEAIYIHKRKTYLFMDRAWGKETRKRK